MKLLRTNSRTVSYTHLKCTVTRLRILSYKMLRSRLVYYFMEHKISPDTALLEHNQVQLAEYLGVTRPALSKEIRCV